MAIRQSKLPSSVSLADLARLIGVTRSRCNELERQGVFKKLKHGTYPISAVASYCEFQREALQGSGAGAGLTAERAELVRERVIMARLEREERQGNLLPRDQVQSTWDSIVMVIRTALLAIPNRVAAQWSSLRSPQEAEAFVKTLIYEAMDAVRSTEMVIDDGDDDPDGEQEAA
jgi:phage terminase Nu1 subunit (DNA packaging protein)